MTCHTHPVRRVLNQSDIFGRSYGRLYIVETDFGGKQPKTSTAGNIAYALFVLFCFWAGTQLLNMLVHAPGVYEHLMQVQDTGRPRVEIGLGVSTVFGLIPFLAGSMVLGVIALVLRWRNRH